MRGFGNPLYVNGQLFQQPVTISHVPGPGVAGVLRGFGIDPSMGGLGSYAVYQPTRGMPRGFGEDAPVVVSPPSGGAPIVFRAPTALEWALAAAGIASTAGLIYHGYKRNDSIGWAIGWGLLGGIAPIIAWPVAVAQGYGKRKGMTPNRRRAGRVRSNPRKRKRYLSPGDTVTPVKGFPYEGEVFRDGKSIGWIQLGPGGSPRTSLPMRLRSDYQKPNRRRAKKRRSSARRRSRR